MTPWLDDGDVRLYHGDALDVLCSLPGESVQCIVTSPPFWGLRDYGTGSWSGGDESCDHLGPPKASTKSGLKNDGRPADRVGQNEYERGATVPYRDECGKCGAVRVDSQIGLEATPELWCAKLVEVMREARRVLRSDGVCWLEVGDSYANAGAGGDTRSGFNARYHGTGDPGKAEETREQLPAMARMAAGLKPKDLVGAPWLLAFALRADGWYLRSDTIWSRPNPMPESVTDRPTKAHSYVFLLTKSARYYFDADSIREPSSPGTIERFGKGGAPRRASLKDDPNELGNQADLRSRVTDEPLAGRNARSVWSIPTEPTPFAHFATFPQALVERCIKAGTSELGACPECGAPWRRIVDRGEPPPMPTKMSWQRAPMDAPKIAAYLRQHREAAGLTRADVDRALGTVTLYSWFEGRPAGIEVPTVEQWAKLKPILGLGDDLDAEIAALVEVEVTDASGGTDTNGDGHVRRYAKAWNSQATTTGWEPSCLHRHTPYPPGNRPCVVLDPFMGSGTTALVARRLGRHATGIELNAEYLQIAATRLQQLSLLGGTA